jgi:hypothetical protein
MAKILASSPAPNRLYRAERGDMLLTVAGKAYGLKAGGERLKRAQLVNRHPFNWRFHRGATSAFNRKFFPEGIVTMTPRFSCTDTDFNDPMQFTSKGRCFPIIFFPPKGDVWRRAPAEIVQPDPRTCWAAAILSWTKVTPRTKRFRSVDHIVKTFRSLEIQIPSTRGRIRRRFVPGSGGLVRWPKRDVTFKLKTGGSLTIPAGRITLEKIATELGVEFVQKKGSSLKLKDVLDILEKSAGPVMVFKFSPGKIGHASVIFGASKTDKFIGEMDPFPMTGRPTGPAFGKLKTRWLPKFTSFKEHRSGHDWDELVFLFRKK